jgi:flagellar biosynthetic protein FliQ
MNTSDVVLIGRELLCTAILLSAPIVLTSLVLGLVISVFQTITSIQEQTLTFAPRIIAVAFVTVVTLPWTLRVLVGFTERMLQRMGQGAL